MRLIGRLATLVLGACVASVVNAPDAIADAGTPDERLRRRIDAMLTLDHRAVDGDTLHAFDGVRRFFTARGFAPAWTEDDHARSVTDTLLALLEAAPSVGLVPCTYHAGTIARLAAAADLPAGDRVDLELLATDAAIVLAVHLAVGRVSPETFDAEWFVSQGDIDPVAWLEAAAGGGLGEAVRALHPRHPGYRRLLGTYDRMRRLAAGAWPPPPPSGPALRAGASGPAIEALAARLAAMDDLDAAAGADSAALDGAIRRFQRRHGLEVDGVAGPATQARLALAPEAIARTLALNLERWRWLPVSLGERHIRVNIAGFILELVEGEHVVRTERVVVGRAYRRTPVFSSTMRYVVVNPSWEVPPTILKHDIAPAIRRDPSIVAERGMMLLTGWGADERPVEIDAIDWDAIPPGTFPYRVRQRPGPTNPLGEVKLMFPNRFSVYIHDTTARELFARASRTMSSGCIRVDNPIDLTAWALDDPKWTVDALQEAVAAGIERTIPLRAPLPVHLQYWTAWVDEDGTLNVRSDIYDRDARLEKGLEEIDACE